MVVFENVKKEVVPILKKSGYSVEEPLNIYEEARLRKGKVMLVLYTSGKLLLQGPETEVRKVAAELRKLKIGEALAEEKFRSEGGWIIGSDESLKGDTFGGLTVAAVKADDKIRKQLTELGVKDSKLLDDKEIVVLAERIKKITACEIRSILPEEYNMKFGTVTKLLNELHGSCGADLAPGKHIVDKYPGCGVGNLMTEKAESKYVEVAAASILARDAALKQLMVLSKMAGFTIPKGSTHVKLALLELRERKLDFFKFVKMDFRNVGEFLRER